MRGGLPQWRRRRPERPWELKPISGWLLLPALVLVVAATWLVYVLATHAAGAGAGASERIDIVKTALTTAAGAGGAVALLLTFRRQRASEITGAHTIRDATERRVTELYGRAVDQLGSDKAAVRLGGLYALERVAQDNPGQRQTIGNVLCAYLRMPYTPPAQHNIADQRHQEHEVRLTAQRILQDHLRIGARDQDPPATFWPDLDLDLSGAILTKLNLAHCQVRGAQFAGATFTDRASFEGATVTGLAWFEDATFTDGASFEGTAFAGGAWFEGATFTGGGWFDGATFPEGASFEGVTGLTWSFARATVAEVGVEGSSWPEGWAVAARGDSSDGFRLIVERAGR